MSKLSKTIIISPTYDELDNAQVLIPALFYHYPDIHLMIVDDSSPDGTALEIARMQKKFPNLILYQRPGKFGFGTAYKEAFDMVKQDARFDYIVSMDADFSHDFRAIPAMVDKLEDCDFLIGSRYAPGGRVENWSLPRRVLSLFSNWYVRSILGHRIKDLTTGFCCFRKEILGRIPVENLNSRGYSFLVELKHQVLLAGCKVGEYPIIFRERRGGKSKMSKKVILESVLMPWKLRRSKIAKPAKE